MKAIRSRFCAIAFYATVFLAGCSSAEPTFAEKFESVEVGMTFAEVEALIGKGKELPNLSGDNRRLVIYKDGDQRYSVAFVGDECVGAKLMPESLLP